MKTNKSNRHLEYVFSKYVCHLTQMSQDFDMDTTTKGKKGLPTENNLARTVVSKSFCGAP